MAGLPFEILKSIGTMFESCPMVKQSALMELIWDTTCLIKRAIDTVSISCQSLVMPLKNRGAKNCVEGKANKQLLV